MKKKIDYIFQITNIKFPPEIWTNLYIHHKNKFKKITYTYLIIIIDLFS